MTALFEDVIQAEVTPIPAPPPERDEHWIVIALNSGRWAQPQILGGALWLTEESARKAADGLASCWRHKRIVRIPGEGQ